MTTNFLQVWPVILAIDFARYALAAGLLALILFVLRRRLAGRRIGERVHEPGQVLREIAASMRTVVVFSLNGFVIYLCIRSGLVDNYESVADYGWLYFFAAIALSIVAQDAWFYWTHRALHHPWLFRHCHRLHHRSVQPTPWTAYSLNVVEAVVQAVFLPLFLALVPMHDAAIFLFVTHMIVRNVIGHCGYELFPRALADSRWFGWINAVTHHDLHHESVRWNYGLYFTWWDRLMGTEHPRYGARLRGAAKVLAPVALALGIAGGGDAVAAEPIHGEWATQGFSAKVRIEECAGGRLCGRITWLWEPNDSHGRPVADAKNPEEGLRGRPLVGVQMLGGFRKGAAGEWIDGWIYNPEDGRTYSATITLAPDGVLRLRGCALAVLCRTQIWRRAGTFCGLKLSQRIASAAAASHGSSARLSACQPTSLSSAPAASELTRATT
jgi:sterol desaturase/sphingolipid hydroxylase (fatty acid hydroxylase superfamily)